MKNNLQANPMIIRIMVLITCCMLVMLYNKSKAAGPNATFKKAEVVFTRNISKNELKVLVKSGISSTMQLCFFSPAKQLVKEIAVNSGNEIVIKDMKKGTYLYKVLSYDMNVKNGTLTIE